jgi:iron complex outermembrane receptor protein
LMRIQPTFDKTTQFSEELNFSARTFNDRLFLSTGLYFFKEKTPQNVLNLSAGVSPQYSGEVLGGDPGTYLTILTEAAQERLETDNKAFAWYGQADFNITKELELSAGIRGTRETRWSRYSKGYAEPESIVNGAIASAIGNGIAFVLSDQPGVTPVVDWVFGTNVYTLDEQPNGDQILHYPSTFVPGLFQGDELSTTDVAWTPTLNLKYKLGEQMLQRFSLDQAMLYFTYSEGFHAGGVTAGSVDYDQVNEAHINIPAQTGVPCPQGRDFCQLDKLAEPGGGTADPQIFEPEKVVNYEAGIKLAALDRRLQVNVSAFYMDYTNMQVTATASRLGIPIPFIENVGSSVIQGLEWEITALPMPNWRILLNGSFTDADIKEWDSKQTVVSAITGADLGIAYSIDRSDELMPRVPRWQFFASTDYSFHLRTGGVITPSVAVRFTSEIYHGFDRGSWIYSHGGQYYNHGGDIPPVYAPDSSACAGPSPNVRCGWSGGPGADPVINPASGAKWTTTARPTYFLDARLSWISGDGKMEAALWGKNLTNEDDYLVGGIPLADVTGGVGMVFANPRTFGMTATYRFGE